MKVLSVCSGIGAVELAWSGLDFESETFVAHSLRAEGFDASEDGTGRGTPIVPVAYRTSRNCGVWETGETTDAITTATDKSHHVVAFTVSDQSNGFAWERPFAPTLEAHPQSETSHIQKGVCVGRAVRRLTPTECERLQGFPDGWTAIQYRGKPAADGPRYRGLAIPWPCPSWPGSPRASKW